MTQYHISIYIRAASDVDLKNIINLGCDRMEDASPDIEVLDTHIEEVED
jgi:hypothetical protein